MRFAWLMVSFLLVVPPAQSQSVTVHLPPPNHHGEPDEGVSSRYDPLWEKCTAGVLAHKNDAETASFCKAAADVSNDFPPESRVIERRAANVYAATAFGNMGDFKSALPYADRAVEVVKHAKVGGSGAEAAYMTRAQVKAFSGDLQGGDADAIIAEGFAREMVHQGLGVDRLRKDLQFHAELLRRLGRPEDAQKKLAEAAAL
jgi:hypothetical protein